MIEQIADSSHNATDDKRGIECVSRGGVDDEGGQHDLHRYAGGDLDDSLSDVSVVGASDVLTHTDGLSPKDDHHDISGLDVLDRTGIHFYIFCTAQSANY